MKLRQPAGVILAGGRSSRMGRDKALIELSGETLLARALRRFAPQVGMLVVNSNGDAAAYAGFALPLIADAATGYQGPLAGIHAAMLWAEKTTPGATHVATLAVDTPFFPDDLVARLAAAGSEAPAAPVVAASFGHLHPTCGFYPLALADDIAGFLAAGERRVQDFLARHGAQAVDFAPLVGSIGTAMDPFFNVNTTEELAAAEAWLRGRLSV